MKLDPNNSLLEWKLAYDHKLEQGHELEAVSTIGLDNFPAWRFTCCESQNDF